MAGGFTLKNGTLEKLPDLLNSFSKHNYKKKKI